MFMVIHWRLNEASQTQARRAVCNTHLSENIPLQHKATLKRIKMSRMTGCQTVSAPPHPPTQPRRLVFLKRRSYSNAELISPVVNRGHGWSIDSAKTR